MDENALELLSDLANEQADLEALLKSLDEAAWAAPTPAVGWDVKDQVNHLADTDAIAHDTVTGGPRTLAMEIERWQAEGGVVEVGIRTGRTLAPAEVLATWVQNTERVRRALRDADTSAHVPWGLGMSWRSFVTARLMEHWAHGLEIRTAVGAEAADTPRLRHIARLGLSSLPYAFKVAEVEPPQGRTLALRLAAPDGEEWSFGPAAATDTIVGPAAVWCRRAVQRMSFEEAVAAGLELDGPLAEHAARHARTFL